MAPCRVTGTCHLPLDLPALQQHLPLRPWMDLPHTSCNGLPSLGHLTQTPCRPCCIECLRIWTAVVQGTRTCQALQAAVPGETQVSLQDAQAQTRNSVLCTP